MPDKCMSVLRSVAAKLPTYVDQEGSKTAVRSPPPNGHLSSQHKSLYMFTVYMSQFIVITESACAALNNWFSEDKIQINHF